MKNYFEQITNLIQSSLKGSETYQASFQGESSDFVRFNHAKIRQPGAVEQMILDLDIIDGKRHMSSELTLCGNLENDRNQIQATIQTIRSDLAHVPEDPYFMMNSESATSSLIEPSNLPGSSEMLDTILRSANNLDMVGIFANGEIHCGYANSFGCNHWHTVNAFDVNYSLYFKDDKAVKNGLSGKAWDNSKWMNNLSASKRDLNAIQKPAVDLKPGQYRAYLSPAALNEVLGVMSWGGFSRGSFEAKASPFQKLYEGKQSLSKAIQISESPADGTGPKFTFQGFSKPNQVNLIQDGSAREMLVSPRTAMEYKLEQNGAGESEGPQSLVMSGGNLAEQDVLSALGTGIYINNLWYLNFSDKLAGKITGMTRFATFWVENGEVIGPTNVMRFDDGIYNILGSNLESLTADRSFMMSDSTYEHRSTESSLVPGALLGEFNLSL